MSRERFQQVAELFREACGRPAGERAKFLAARCADDEVRREVEALLDLDARPPAALADEALRDGAERRAQVALGGGQRRPRTIGEYEILDELGRGGMGTVYRARQRRPARTVALKVLRSAALSERVRRRFEYEAHILAHLQHPGIAQVFAAGEAETEEGPCPFLAMELVEGRTVTDHADERELDVAARVRLIMDLCNAVQHAHQRGVIHRDLKPANVMVTEAGAVKVLDFGVARATGSDLGVTTLQTLAGQLIGTLAYMSPEQVDADPDRIDTRSDVFSIGVLAYELLAGRLPHDLSELAIYDAARVIREKDPPRLGTIDRALRGDLETIVGRALERDRERRYQSAGELRADLARALAGAPIEARRDSTVYVLRRSLRRHRAPAVVATLFLLTIVVAAAGLLVSYRRTQDEKLIAGSAAAFAARYASELLERADDFAPDQFTPDELKKVEDSLSALSDRPLQAANLSTLLGLQYLEQGRYEAAEEHLRTAYEARLEGAAPLPDLAASMHNLARALFALSRFDDAESLYARAADARGDVLEPNHARTLDSLNGLAACLRRRGQFREATRLFEQVLEGRRATLGDRDKYVAAAMNNLGLCLRDQGRYAEAEPLLREALARIEGTPADRPLFIARSLRSIGTCRLGQGDVTAARDLFIEALRLMRAADGDHPDVARCRYQLARCALALGQRESAEAECRAVLARQEAELPQPHADTADTRALLGRILVERDLFAGAEACLVEVRGARVALLGADHPAVAAVDALRARAAARRGAFAEARRLADAARATLDTQVAPTHPAQAELQETEALLAAVGGASPTDRSSEEERP